MPRLVITVNKVWMVRLVCCEDGCHFIVVCWMDVFINAVSRQLYLLKLTSIRSVTHQGQQTRGGHIMSVKPTCERPKWTDAVSDMYIIFPSGATTKMKPSNVWKKQQKSVRYQQNSLNDLPFNKQMLLSCVHLCGPCVNTVVSYYYDVYYVLLCVSLCCNNIMT